MYRYIGISLSLSICLYVYIYIYMYIHIHKVLAETPTAPSSSLPRPAPVHTTRLYVIHACIYIVFSFFFFKTRAAKPTAARKGGSMQALASDLPGHIHVSI